MNILSRIRIFCHQGKTYETFIPPCQSISPSVNILSRIRIFCLCGKYTGSNSDIDCTFELTIKFLKKVLFSSFVFKFLDGIDFGISQLQSAELRTTDGDRSKFANILPRLQILYLNS